MYRKIDFTCWACGGAMAASQENVAMCPDPDCDTSPLSSVVSDKDAADAARLSTLHNWEPK